MTDPRVFDSFADSYSATVQATIAASGEAVEFFAEVKVQWTRRIVGAAGPQRVLDFGCGVGNATRLLQAYFSAADVIGFDPSEESIATARKLSAGRPGPRFVSGQRQDLPFPDASFDVVFTSCVFHHIDRPAHTHWAREIRRVLRPSGTLLLFEHNPYNPLTRGAVRDCPFDRGVELLRSGYAVRMLREAGFAPERPWFYFFFPHALRALRPLEPMLRRIPIGAQYFVVAIPSR